MSQTPGVSPAATRTGSDVDDPSIPLLTDRIFLPALELDIAVPQAQPPAAPALQPSAYAAVAARTVDYSPVEVIGSDELPLVTLGEAEALNEAPERIAVATPHRGGPSPEAEAEIETELDRDLIAELDADFEALLSAEADLDHASAAASAAAAPIVESDRRDDAAPESSAERTDVSAATEAAAAPPAPVGANEGSGDTQDEATAEQPAPSQATPVVDSAVAASTAEAPVEASAETSTEPSANLADDVAQLDEGHEPAVPAAEAIGPPPESPAPSAPRPDQQALAAEAEGLRTAVLDSVAQRLPAHIDTTVRELMQPAIDEAVARLGEEAQVALRISLQQLVEQVLREELDRRLADREPPAR